MTQPLSSDDDIFSLTNRFLIKTSLPDKVRFLAVGVYGLNEFSNQLVMLFKSKHPSKALRPPLARDQPLAEKHPLAMDAELGQALDKINGRYGKQVVYRGRMWETGNLAKERIGFRKLDDI